jgi:hypothetical protein
MPGNTIPTNAFSNSVTNGRQGLAFQFWPDTGVGKPAAPLLPPGAHWNGPNNLMTIIHSARNMLSKPVFPQAAPAQAASSRLAGPQALPALAQRVVGGGEPPSVINNGLLGTGQGTSHIGFSPPLPRGSGRAV